MTFSLLIVPLFVYMMLKVTNTISLFSFLVKIFGYIHNLDKMLSRDEDEQSGPGDEIYLM